MERKKASDFPQELLDISFDLQKRPENFPPCS
jgi:hypothetical protein